MTEDTAATEATDLDKTRRYLRPVAATIISENPDGVHLAVYEWLPMFEEWVTGPGICGESMRQGALPEGTVVTCARCLEWQPKYERYVAPGYQPEDDDPETLRERIDRVRGLHRPIQHMGQSWCAECSVRRRTGPTTEEWVAFIPHPCPTIQALDGEA